MKIYHCEVNHLTNPLGYQMEKTVFSWQVGETAAKLPKWTRLRVSEESALSSSPLSSAVLHLFAPNINKYIKTAIIITRL